MAKQRRRLEDLYRRGRMVSVNDGGGDPVEVWVQKMNPLEHEKAIRKASAAKAQMLIGRHNRESDTWQEALAEIDEIRDRDGRIEYLLAEPMLKIRESIEAELAFADEWKTDSYLEGLRNAWEDPEKPLADTYAANPDDEEASRVFLELKRFNDQVEERVAPELERLKRDYEAVSDEEIENRMVQKFIELRAGMAWLREYRRCELFYATRDPDDHDKYYFEDREDIDALASEVYRELATAYEILSVEIPEGKGSPETPSSSPSSEPRSEEAISGQSGLQPVLP